MQGVSNLGDVLVLSPASLALVVALAWAGARRDAAAYFVAVVLCIAAVLLAKLAFAACGAGRPHFAVASPSGHAAFAATFYGCLAALFATGRGLGWRLAIFAMATVIILAIAVSRVALAHHTAPEVVVGLAIGAVSIALFVALRGKPSRIELSFGSLARMSPIIALYVACVLLPAGRWTAEPFIDALAARLGAALSLCE